MKILHITYSLNEGGVDTYLLELLPKVKEKIASVDLLVLCDINEKLKQKLEDNGINVAKGKYKNIYNPLNIFYIGDIIKKNNYDIIHSHLFPIQYYVIFASILYRYKKRLITTEHCTTNKRRGKYIFRILDRYIYRHYDKIIGVSYKASENLNNWLGGVNNIVAIPNGIDLSRIYEAKPYNKQDFNFKYSDIIIMMVARFFHQKDHKTAIKAMKYLSDEYKLVFVGSGNLLEQCKSLCQNLELDKRVIFLGNRKDVPSLIKSADIGLLSTHFEGLPISIIEFMAAGKPVIGSDVDGIRELVEDKNLLFEEENEKELANCIKYLMINDRREKIGDYMYKKSYNYDLNIMADKYCEIYNLIYKI